MSSLVHLPKNVSPAAQSTPVPSNLSLAGAKRIVKKRILVRIVISTMLGLLMVIFGIELKMEGEAFLTSSVGLSLCATFLVLLAWLVIRFGVEPPARAFCGQCEAYIPSTIEWLCGFCETPVTAPVKSFLDKCPNCKRPPSAFICPSCTTPLPLDQTMNYQRPARALNTKPIPHETPEERKEHRAEMKDDLKFKVEMAELARRYDDLLTDHQKRQAAKNPKSDREVIREDFEKYSSKVFGVEELVIEQLAKARIRYSHDQATLDRFEEMLEEWKKKRM